MKPTIGLFCIFFFTSGQVFGQKENYIWYFGDGAGLDFNTSPPTTLQSPMIAHEGVASIADAAGNLLFYTDGIMVWDRNHHVMPNGSDLLGGWSSSQAALIAPLPNSTTQYYLFATEHQITDGGLSYSIVDMTLNGGLGDIVMDTKNTLLVDKTTEQVTSLLHCNGRDIWIVTHLTNSNVFLSFLLTDTGINSIPVSSAIGSFFPDIQPGLIKASHRGFKIVSNYSCIGIAEMFDFNATTGEVSNFVDLEHLLIPPLEPLIYGIEFSPNDSLLYLTGSGGCYETSTNYLFQIDLASFTVTVLNVSSPYYYGSLQLGPDHQIYMAKVPSPYLDIIHEPDKRGIACLYEEDTIRLKDSTQSRYGLPNIVPFSLVSFSIGKDTVLCHGSSILLEANLPGGFDFVNYLWSDGSSGKTLTVDQPGLYWVEVELPCRNISDTIQIDFISCNPIVVYSLEACSAYMSNGSNMDYTEFIPSYPYQLNCANITASNVFRSPPLENKHSCTPGIGDSIAMCISAYNSCTYIPGQASSLIMEVVINPAPDSVVRLSRLEFYEKAPAEYNWIDGGTGANNFPTKYGFRILKNGIEIYRQYLLTKPNWTKDIFDFLNDDDFIVDDNSVIRIELLPYCLVGNGAQVAAWDIDEIKIFGECVSPDQHPSVITGHVLTQSERPVAGVELQLTMKASVFEYPATTTNKFGAYTFINLERDTTYYLKGYKNDGVRKGISTLDLVYLQRHLLGMTPFTSLHQFVAADINRSGTITVIDLLELRKLILGHYSSFPDNTSWRFGALPQDLDGSHLTDFKEVCKIENLDRDTVTVDFVGIKIGDINGDIQLQNLSSALTPREADLFSLWFEEEATQPHIPFSVQIKAGQEMNIAGMQMALDLNGMELISVDESIFPDVTEYFSCIDGILRISWHAKETVHVAENATLFSLRINSARGGPLDRQITLADTLLEPEVYLEHFDVKKLTFHIEKPAFLSQNVNFLRIEPNPVTSDAIVHFNIAHGGCAHLRIFDLSGQALYQSKKNYMPGEHWEKIETHEFRSASGVLFCQLISNEFNSLERIIKLD